MSRLSSRLLAVIGLSLLVVAVLSAPASQRRGLNRAAFARLNPVFGAPIAKEIRKPNTLPQGWKVDAEQPINGAELVTLTFALKQRNLDVLEKKFWDVSTPFSGEYGQFLSFSDVSDLVRPTPESVSFVRDWLVSNGIPASQHRITLSGDWLQVDLPVSAAQELLQCRFLAFRHISTDIRILRSLVPYYVPALVAEKIDFVGGVLRFPSIQHASYKEAAAGKTTPQLIRQWYNITDVGKSPLNTQSVSQFLGQFYSPNDLTLFQTQNNLPALQPTVVGPNTPKKPGAEASLDIEYITATAENVKTYFISTAGLHEGQEPFLEWIVGLNNNSDSPYINSISYGDTESTLTVDYTSRINVEFQKFGITGRTLLFSSGDNGVGCDKCTTLQPNFPASSPFVTAVGGTELNSAQTVEVGVTFSSGGFSNYFGVAGYQSTAVKKYFSTATTLPPASSYNSTGRGFPDISAFATNFDIVVDGLNTQVDGTSCSSPTSAGIFALLNDLRLQNNQPALGFLNPLIYSLASNTPGAFNDILQGNNDNTCCTGFNAAAGWDPITGVGSPNYAVLKTAVLSPSLFE